MRRRVWGFLSWIRVFITHACMHGQPKICMHAERQVVVLRKALWMGRGHANALMLFYRPAHWIEAASACMQSGTMDGRAPLSMGGP